MSLLKKGVFLLSIDVEMAWGVVQTGRGKEDYTSRDVRGVIDRLLKLFEKYEIRATWAVVGHLFLDHCRPVNGRKHPEIVRPSYAWRRGDWFDRDPCTDINADPRWYGSDIVARMRDCEVPQEIASHSFSHIAVSYRGCSSQCFDSELEACRRLAASLGLTLKSFVFPWNSVGHLDVLAKNGFIAYRERTPVKFARVSRPKKTVLGILDKLWPQAASAVFPDLHDGLWGLTATYFYDPASRRMRWLPTGVWLLRVRQRLFQAARQRALFHLWFHTHNLTSDPETSLIGLEAILRQVNKLREAGKLDNPTMGELADSLRHGYPLPPCTLSSGSDTA